LQTLGRLDIPAVEVILSMSVDPSVPAGEEQEIRQQLATRNRVLETSSTLGQAVAAELELEPLCDVVCQQLEGVFRPEILALLFLNESTGELSVKRSAGPGASKADLTGLTARDGVACVAMRDRTLVVRRDPEGGPGSGPVLAARALVAVPLLAERRAKGVLVLIWGAAGGRPSAEDLLLLPALAGQVAAAIDNAWLYGELKRLNETLEEKVRLRTAELDQAQIQMAQREKMASLGQLTAGIAHEINNPLSYAINNVSLARERLVSLELRLDLLQLSESLARLPEAAARTLRLSCFLESLAEDPRYQKDIVGFRADCADLPAEAQARLGQEFVRYVRTREEESDPQGELSTSVSRLLGSALEGLSRVKRIVGDLRSFSRLDASEFQQADLDAEIERTLEIVFHLARDRRVALQQVRGLAGPYGCFPARLNQVVLNMVTNAIQATAEGGQVVVSTRETEAGPVIEVTDTGQGIAPEHLSRVFDPFFTTKPAGQGTGLGLSISYQFVAEHGGKIEVQSQPGKGASFRILLPSQNGPRRGT